jgi:hypothetical protein
MNMKVVAMLILLLVVLSFASPVTITGHSSSREFLLLAINVCHASGAPLYHDSTMPALTESPCNVVHSSFPGICQSFERVSRPSFIAFQKDHPPKV